MDKTTKGAWLLAQSKCLDAVTGAGRLENIAYAGRVGRLYNLLRRNIIDEPSPTINGETVRNICQMNGIDRASREAGLSHLQREGRIDVASNGAISVLGATSTAVLETTADIYRDANPGPDEEAVIELSETVAQRPIDRKEAEEYIGDVFSLARADACSLIDLCKGTAILDEESDRQKTILFNSNTFRDGQYAKKTHYLMEALTAGDRAKLSELQEKLNREGAVLDTDAKRMLGSSLYDRLISVGLFDRLEVSNSAEAVGYITSPNHFQKFGRPFENDPIDDAKALLASLTYGQTRSTYARGSITMPKALLTALISGREIGGKGVKAIGEDYKELERRQVVQVTQRGADRYTMKLLKKDVGELALTIVVGGAPAQEAILLDGSAATAFRGPHETRQDVRVHTRNAVNDRKFMTEALDRLRSGAY
ncbi:TPA: hypothetical protein ACT5B2_003397 [Burkholderia cenocepacia]|uniref:hypothetical protein n=1 Tax=Burkholderia cenocepacia TaxID=95486 RepID=UPI002AB7DB66|nr:hypothetical protein [Burkholderia cenocepacia]